jgi:hypothetical protein
VNYVGGLDRFHEEEKKGLIKNDELKTYFLASLSALSALILTPAANFYKVKYLLRLVL